jgi:hypothetical protein
MVAWAGFADPAEPTLGVSVMAPQTTAECYLEFFCPAAMVPPLLPEVASPPSEKLLEWITFSSPCLSLRACLFLLPAKLPSFSQHGFLSYMVAPSLQHTPSAHAPWARTGTRREGCPHRHNAQSKSSTSRTQEQFPMLERLGAVRNCNIP